MYCAHGKDFSGCPAMNRHGKELTSVVSVSGKNRHDARAEYYHLEEPTQKRTDILFVGVFCLFVFDTINVGLYGQWVL